MSLLFFSFKTWMPGTLARRRASTQARRTLYQSKPLANTHAAHETFPELHGVAPGLSGSRLVVDAHADQVRPGSRQRLLDEAFEIFFIGGPAAVGEAAADGDGDNI